MSVTHSKKPITVRIQIGDIVHEETVKEVDFERDARDAEGNIVRRLTIWPIRSRERIRTPTSAIRIVNNDDKLDDAG